MTVIVQVLLILGYHSREQWRVTQLTVGAKYGSMLYIYVLTEVL